MRVVLMLKKKYIDQIKAGEKNFELRAGRRYRNIAAGDELLINGNQMSLRVTRTVAFPTFESAAEATGIDLDELRSLYPDVDPPLYAFYFETPRAIQRIRSRVIEMRLAGLTFDVLHRRGRVDQRGGFTRDESPRVILQQTQISLTTEDAARARRS